MRKYLLLIVVCMMPVSLFALRKKFNKSRPAMHVIIPQKMNFQQSKVKQQVTEKMRQEYDVSKVSDTNVADQPLAESVEQNDNEATEIRVDDVVESNIESLQDNPDPEVVAEEITQEDEGFEIFDMSVADQPLAESVEQNDNEPMELSVDEVEEPAPEIKEVVVASSQFSPMRLLHIAAGDRDKYELEVIVREAGLEPFSSFFFDVEDQNQFDILLLSNMSQLRHLGAQLNDFKYIILWVTGRCADVEYTLIRDMAEREHVCIVAGTSHEKEYMRNRGISVDRAVVIPSQQMPLSFVDRSSLFLPSGLSESQLKRVIVGCAAQGIRIRGDYRGTTYCAPLEGVLCVPGILPDHLVSEYARQGGVMFVPTMRFLKRSRILSKDQLNTVYTSEWYKADRADCIRYFNCWDDLKTKMRETDYVVLTEKMKQLSLEDLNEVPTSWKELFEEIA